MTALTAVLLGLVLALALGFAFTNGFHDAANSVSTTVMTRAVTTRRALAMAAVLNLLGALLGTRVAVTIGSEVLYGDDVVAASGAGTGPVGLAVVGGALTGAVAWNLTTWWAGLPSSSSHALIGALAGAGVAGGITVHWEVLAGLVLVPMLLSPLIGLLGAWGLTRLIHWLVAARPYGRTTRQLRLLETVAAAATALGHGLQDAQKTMGVMVLALAAGGVLGHSGAAQDLAGLEAGTVPLWVRLTAALALAAGTAAGGLRIIRTLGSGIAEVDPAQGFAAQCVSALVLYTTALTSGAPVSTTYTVASSITGAALVRGRRRVGWGTVGRIATAWLVTLPAAALLGGVAATVLVALARLAA